MRTTRYMSYEIRRTQDERWRIADAPRGGKVFSTLQEAKQRVDEIVEDLADRLSKQRGPLVFMKRGR